MKPLSLDMNSFELHDWIAENGPVHVVFSEGVDDKESYAGVGIQGIVVGLRKDAPNEDGIIEVIKWDVDYTRFEVVNSLHEDANYYGHADQSPAYLKAYSAGHYKRKDYIYMESQDTLSTILQSIVPAATLEVTAEAVEQRFADIEKALGSFSI